MSVKCRDIISYLNTIMPFKLAENWDNCGLLIGDMENDINKIFLTLDLTPDVLNEAIENKVNMIITHHPFILQPLKSLRFNDNYGKMVQLIIKNDIQLVACHTNFDLALFGVSEFLANKLGLTDLKKLEPRYNEKYFKLVVFVPEEYASKVKEAICKVGAGHVGNYSHCTFDTIGEGNFKPLEDTNPFIGSKGILEKVKEKKVETIVPESILNKVLFAMNEAHPYEEVAYDTYLLENKIVDSGLGVVGKLKKSLALKELLNLIKDTVNIKYLRFTGDINDKVSKIAICGGAGKSLITTVASKADVFITGELGYHDAEITYKKGLKLIEAGHYATEFLSLDYLVALLQKNVQNIDVSIAKTTKDLWKYF